MSELTAARLAEIREATERVIGYNDTFNTWQYNKATDPATVLAMLDLIDELSVILHKTAEAMGHVVGMGLPYWETAAQMKDELERLRWASKQARTALETVRDQVERMMAAAKPIGEGEWVESYHIQTGALHFMAGLVRGGAVTAALDVLPPTSPR